MEEQSQPNNTSGSGDQSMSSLKERLVEGLIILSDKLTTKTRKEHPFYISYKDRGLRYGILNNKHIKKSTIKCFHPNQYTLKQLEKLFNDINKWADKCDSAFKSIYNEAYSNRFNIFRLPNSVLKVSTDEDSLAILQNQLKTQLENLLNFLVHRIAYFEEFGQYDNIMQIELLIDKYTRNLFELLYNIGSHNKVELHSNYLDPLSFFVISKISNHLHDNPKADIKFVIDKSKSIFNELAREDFDFSSGVPLGLQDAENINSRIRVIKDNFEREYCELSIGILPEKFKFIWDKDIEDFHGYQRTIDLMEALNRLPIYMRDLKLANSMIPNNGSKILKVNSNKRFILNDPIDYTEFIIDGETFHMRKNTIMAAAIKFIHKRALNEGNKSVPGHKILDNSGSKAKSIKALFKNRKYCDGYHPALKLFTKTKDQKYIFNPKYL